MKKNRQLRWAAGCLLAGLTLLQPACSVRKQQEKSMWRQAETYLLHTDSLFSANKHRMESECVRHWEMVCLSPPDSAGRQHLSAIIRSRDTCHSRSFSEDSLRRHSSGAVRQKEDSRSYDKTEKQPSPAATWKWAAGGILFIGGIAWLRRRYLR